MPSRTLTCAIVLFWLGTTGWMFYREVLRWALADRPPPITFDITEEVGGHAISWTVLKLEQKDGVKQETAIGRGLSTIRRLRQHVYEMTSEFKFDEFDKLILKLGPAEVPLTKIASSYRITHEGKLRGLQARVYIRPPADSLVRTFIKESVEIRGIVDAGHLKLRLFVDEREYAHLGLEPVPIDEDLNILNPMHLLNRVPGLREGQQWRIPLLDPFAVPLEALPLAGGAGRMPKLEARVSAARLHWNGDDVACFRIDYNEPNRPVSASTWVRQRDSLVLQQEATHQAMHLVLRREAK